MYNRYARSKEFDRALDERDGFVRLTDRNWGSLVSPFAILIGAIVRLESGWLRGSCVG